MNKDAYYFPHFSNARHDRKLRRVRKELGIEGYGIYFMLLEVLRDQDDFSYPLSDIDLLADEFNTSEQKIEVVISKYRLFKIDDDKFFFSPKLIEYLKPYLDRSKRARKAALKRWHGDSDAKASANALPVQSARNASKVKEKKVEDLYTQFPFSDFWDAYDKKKDKKKCESKWKKLTDSDKESIMNFIPIYKRHQPTSQYRKNPLTFLNNETWNDDWDEYSGRNNGQDEILTPEHYL